MTGTPKTKKPIKFALIGGANTALDFGILFALQAAGLPVVIANTVSTFIAFLFSFTMNRKFTFQSTGENVQRELVLFIAVTLFGLWGIQNAIIWLLTPPLQAAGVPAAAVVLTAKLIATLASLTWNYFMYDRVVFKQKKEQA